MMRVLKSRAGVAVVAFVIGASGAAGIAWAAIPDSTTGLITACYPTSGTNNGVLHVIDYQAGTRCASGEAMLTWGPGSNCDSFPHPGVNWVNPVSAAGNGCDFSFANLSGQNLTGAKAVNANLAGANLRNARVDSANFARANLSNTVWCGVNAVGTDITNAMLTNAALALTTGCRAPSFTGLKGLTSAQLRSIRKQGRDSLCGGPTVGQYLYSVRFSGVDLSSFDLTDFNLGQAIFSGESLSSANLTRVWAQSLDASNASLAGAVFNCAFLYGANFMGANMTNANMTNANLKLANLTNAALSGVTWSNTTCPDGTNSNNDGNTCVGHT